HMLWLFFSSRRRHTRLVSDWSSDVCSSDLAKGADLRYMYAELFGKQTGYCKGRGGSMHINDLSIGMLGANGIVGGGIPHALGARSEERRVGKERRARGCAAQLENKRVGM